MVPDVIRLSPEVEEILREVARRPGSSLLRVAREDVDRTVLEGSALARVTSPGLHEAERQLVRAHREEVAFVLRQAAYLRLARGEDTRLWVIDSVLPSTRRQVPELRSVQLRAAAAVRASAEFVDELDGMELLEACVGGGLGRWPTARQLASASHRLVPTDQARIYVGLDYCAGEMPGSALHVFGSLLPRQRGAAFATEVYCNISHAYSLSDDSVRAMQASCEATRLDPGHAPSWINRLIFAARLGHLQEAIAASRMLLDLGASTDAGVISWMRGRQRRAMRLSQHDNSAVVLESVYRKVGPEAGELINAML